MSSSSLGQSCFKILTLDLPRSKTLASIEDSACLNAFFENLPTLQIEASQNFSVEIHKLLNLQKIEAFSFSTTKKELSLNEYKSGLNLANRIIYCKKNCPLTPSEEIKTPSDNALYTTSESRAALHTAKPF